LYLIVLSLVIEKWLDFVVSMAAKQRGDQMSTCHFSGKYLL